QFNAARAGLENLHAIPQTAAEHLAPLGKGPDFVVRAPARTGLGKAVVGRWAELRPRQITIVACDPATLARDLAGLVAAGYRVERMTLVDLFPQTYHLETVARLRLAEKRVRVGGRRLKPGGSQDWLPHKAPIDVL